MDLELQGKLAFKIEKSLDQSQLVYAGFGILSIVRQELFHAAGLETATQPISKLRSLASTLKGISQLLLAPKPANFRLGDETEILMLGVTSHRNELVDDKHFNRIIDSLALFIPKNYCYEIIEALAGQLPKSPTYHAVISLQSLKAHAVHQANKKIIFPDQQLKRISTYLQKTFAAHEIDAIFVKKILWRVLYVDSLAQALALSIRESKIKWIFSDVYYGDEGFAFMLTGSRLNIPTIDIQHGDQDVNHIAYNDFQHYQKESLRLLPSIFWNWTTQFETRLKQHLPVNSTVNTLVGGDVHIQAIVKGLISTMPSLALSNLKKKYKHIVFISLQMLTDQEVVVMDEFAREIQAINTDIGFVIRSHPSFERQAEKWFNGEENCLDRDRCYFHHPVEENLFAVLMNCDVHATCHSSISLQAMYYGRKTVLLNENGLNCFKHHVEANDMIDFNNSNFMTLFAAELDKNLNDQSIPLHLSVHDAFAHLGIK